MKMKNVTSSGKEAKMLIDMEPLGKRGHILLARAAGKQLKDVDSGTLGAFMAVNRCRKKEYVEKVFPAACFMAAQEKNKVADETDNGTVELPQAWREFIKEKESESLGRRMDKLLDTKWGQNYVTSLWRIIRMLDRDDIDYEKLAWDIIHWDDKDRRVQIKWQTIIYSNFEEKGNE